MCSVTLRRLAPEDVLRVAVGAGLACVEWGGDVHVPAGDVTTARRVRQVSADNGIAVAAYGSYFRAGPHGADEFAPVLASAVALGAPRIRIWAGTVGSAAATAEQRRAVASATRRAAAHAADAGIALSFEYHGGTLTDSPDSTLRLLDEVGPPAVGTYWQPPVGQPDAAALDGLCHVLAAITAVHVFSWWPERERLALSARAPLWRTALTTLAATGRTLDCLLEFVADYDPARLAADATELHHLIGRPARPHRSGPRS